MANGHGGPRTPANPAPVSGPGALSRRTDGKQPILDLPNAKYGENADFRSAQAGAPLPQVPSSPSAPAPPPASNMELPTPLSAGTMLPNEPVTHGADAGPGADTSVLNLSNPVQAQHQSALSLIQQLAAQPQASPAMQALASSLQQGF